MEQKDDWVYGEAWEGILGRARELPAIPVLHDSGQHVSEERLWRYAGRLAVSRTDKPETLAEKAHIIGCPQCLAAVSAVKAIEQSRGFLVALLDALRQGAGGAPTGRTSRIGNGRLAPALVLGGSGGARPEQPSYEQPEPGVERLRSPDFRVELCDKPGNAGLTVTVTATQAGRSDCVLVELLTRERDVQLELRIDDTHGCRQGCHDVADVSLADVTGVCVRYSS